MDAKDHPTPVAGTPVPVSAPNDPILSSLELLRAELRETRDELRKTREESRLRGEETGHRFDKLDRRLDRQAADDEAIRTEVHRLQTRVKFLEEQLDELIEQERANRQRRTEESNALDATLLGIRRHVETVSTTAQNAIEKLSGATETFAKGTEKIEAISLEVKGVADENGVQNAALAAVARKTDAIVTELGLELDEEGNEKKDGDSSASKPTKLTVAADSARRSTKVTWGVVALAVAQIILALAKLLGSGH